MRKGSGLSPLHKEKQIGWFVENKNEGSRNRSVDIGKIRAL